MKTTTRMVGAGLTAVAAAAALCGTSSATAAPQVARDGYGTRTVQLIGFNDFHGHLEATDPPLAEDPAKTPVGGVEYLSSTINRLRAEAGGNRNSLTLSAGDNIGGSTFLSGLFHDEPTIEALNAIGVDASALGNHEFDEGLAELKRMRDGGCHPVEGCYFPDEPYEGADFPFLAANIYDKKTGHRPFQGSAIKFANGQRIGIIGVTLRETPTLVSPDGVKDIEFRDEVASANAQVDVLKAKGVNSIVVLLHQGGTTTGGIQDCTDLQDERFRQMVGGFRHEIDMVITGHTHNSYVCNVPDPAGEPRMVTSAGDWGRMVTDARLVVDTRTGEVIRNASSATNVLVTREDADPVMTELLQKWQALAGPIGGRVVGTVAQDITGDSSGDRGIETPMADTVADAILDATDGTAGGAQISFMNVGGVRASLLRDQITSGEAPGEITYAEAYKVLPFGNLLVSMDMTGAQIKQALEQQYQPVAERGSRPMLALGVSEGFSYTWDATQPQGSRVVDGSMTLNGQPIQLDQTYRVSTLNFLQQGGDMFTAFTQGTNVLGGQEDLAAFVNYLQTNPGLTPPADRVNGL